MPRVAARPPPRSCALLEALDERERAFWATAGALMGHSGIRVTFDLYGQLLPDARRDALRQLDDFLASDQ
jgi:integrase